MSKINFYVSVFLALVVAFVVLPNSASEIAFADVQHAANSAAPRYQSGSIYDFLVMNVCVDAADNPTNQDPLHCPIEQQRDIRFGEAVPYFHATYPAVSDHSPCDKFGAVRRYAFPLRTEASDQTGASYPLFVGWTNNPISKDDCTWGVFNPRDTASLLVVEPEFANLLGSKVKGQWYVSMAAGYADPATDGVARFDRTWVFPTKIPPIGGGGFGIFPRHLTGLKTVSEISALPDHDRSLHFQRTIEWWKRLMFVYGPSSAPTKPLDTLIEFGFARTNETNDGPGESTGSEHLYLTREFGYVTRWEDWHREDAKNALEAAHKAYDNQNCGDPADIQGQLTPHFQVGPVVNNSIDHVYSQVLTVTDTAGNKKSHTWYLAGCHDLTNVHPAAPFDPSSAVNEAIFSKEFLGLFQKRANH